MKLQEYLQTSTEGDLTIISSSFKSAKFLNLNLALTKTLNPDKKIFWIIVQNTPLEFRSSDELNEEFIIIDGPVITGEEKKSIGYGSFQHAKAINIATTYVNTRYFLVLDPDCYIVQPKWMTSILELMENNNITFFGTPYHPERLNYFNIFGRTYLDFPCAICLLIDKKNLQKNGVYNLDFTPNIAGNFNLISHQEELRRDLIHIKGTGRYLTILNFIKYVVNYGALRGWHLLRIGNYSWVYDPRPDIGSLIYINFSKKFKSLITPTYYPKKTPFPIKILTSLRINIFKGYPVKSCNWIKYPHKLVDKKLISQGRWEQFFLHDKLFCIHLGKVSYAGDSDDYLNMKNFLNQFLISDLGLNYLDLPLKN